MKIILGLVGLLALLITVTIVVFSMVGQYEELGLIRQDGSTTTNIDQTGSQTLSPIESAENVRNLIETRDKNLLDQ